MTNTEYIIKCLAERHEIIYNKLNSIFNNDHIFIILGARDEWSYFLKNYVYDKEPIFKELNDTHGYEFYYDDHKNLLFSYYPMFKRGSKSSDAIKMFCKELSGKLPQHLIQKINM